MPLFQGIELPKQKSVAEENKNTSKPKEDFDISQDKSIQEAIAMMGGKPKVIVQEKKFKSIIMGSANLVQIDLGKDIDKQVYTLLENSKENRETSKELSEMYNIDLVGSIVKQEDVRKNVSKYRDEKEENKLQTETSSQALTTHTKNLVLQLPDDMQDEINNSNDKEATLNKIERKIRDQINEHNKTIAQGFELDQDQQDELVYLKELEAEFNKKAELEKEIKQQKQREEKLNQEIADFESQIQSIEQTLTYQIKEQVMEDKAFLKSIGVDVDELEKHSISMVADPLNKGERIPSIRPTVAENNKYKKEFAEKFKDNPDLKNFIEKIKQTQDATDKLTAGSLSLEEEREMSKKENSFRVEKFTHKNGEDFYFVREEIEPTEEEEKKISNTYFVDQEGNSVDIVTLAKNDPEAFKDCMAAMREVPPRDKFDNMYFSHGEGMFNEQDLKQGLIIDLKQEKQEQDLTIGLQQKEQSQTLAIELEEESQQKQTQDDFQLKDAKNKQIPEQYSDIIDSLDLASLKQQDNGQPQVEQRQKRSGGLGPM